MIRIVPRRSATLAVLALLAASFSTTLVIAAATASTTYRPTHAIHFDAGTYTGYKFNASGGITASRTATLPRASGASTSLSTPITSRPGNWLLITNGVWEGYYLRESNRTYLPFTRLRVVSFAAGAHTGYKFNASGTVIAHKTSTLARTSSAHASAQALIGSSTSYLLIADGVWAGYWVPIGSGVGLRYPPLGAGRLALSSVVSGLDQPLYVTNAGDGSGRLFVVERTGLVRVVSGSLLQPTAFLDLTTKISCCTGERGLLGLAFHPSFASNLRLFASYTDSTGDVIVAEYTANAARTSASAATERVIVRISHRTYANHNGGWIGFGPDGYLYISTETEVAAATRSAAARTRTHCWARCCASTSTAYSRTPFRRAIRSPRVVEPRKCGRGDCAIRGATASTASAVTCTSATWDRAHTKRSTARDAASAARTTAGT